MATPIMAETSLNSLEGSSSRIFVKGLPRNITDDDLRRHFSAKGREITDLKLMPKRGIGFVGYKSPDEAAKAVKYFNRTYIRMSKLSVELAKPLSESWRDKAGKDGDLHDAAISKPIIEPNPNKRKRDEVDESNPKLKEFLEVMQPSRNTGQSEPQEAAAEAIPDADSDAEYDAIPTLKQKQQIPPETGADESQPRQEKRKKTSKMLGEENQDSASPEHKEILESEPTDPTLPNNNATDDEWLRSRTNRLLDLMDVDELDSAQLRPASAVVEESPADPDPGEARDTSPAPSEPGDPLATAEANINTTDTATVDKIRETSRLYVRNLPYSATEDDLSEYFKKFGELEQVHLSVDRSGTSKGFAFVQYADSSTAVDAFKSTDGSTFQGRILHVLAGERRRYEGLDEFAISKLPLKTQNQIRRKNEAPKSSFSWNSLYMSQDAVTSSVAKRLGVSKSEVLDPTSSDAAVKQAIAETSIIQETKSYFTANGVDLDAFKSKRRGDTAILVKNFPHGTTTEELRTMFEEHGTVLRVLMPPSGTIAIVHFAHATQGKTAFQNICFRRFKDSILFLEKGPMELFGKAEDGRVAEVKEDRPTGVQKLSVTELLEQDDETQEIDTTSLFVKNLNFDTTTESLAAAFGALDGFQSAVVKTKTDPKKPGQVLSMGFGFVELRTKEAAQAALKTMDGFVLDGHALSVKVSHKGHDAAEERRREDKAKKQSGQRTKIIIKNLPFEASKKDVRTLFGTYGKLRAVRVPKKFGTHSSRGFAFAEFVTPREAENALNALKDTHLLGRRLVLGFAEADAIDPEEEIAKMQRKIGQQVNKVNLQKLTGGRKKVTIGETGDDEFDA